MQSEGAIRLNSNGSRVRSSSIDEEPSVNELSRSPPVGKHSPVVAAMLRKNLMKDCHQVRDMFFQCMEDSSNSSICDTAKSYFVQCHRDN
mmetsp:Transcript_2977/g.5083  ORF Transcript_2977/g.5083 Transcript_2977/m.5083 type:complete len:90 (-) Transcript_2977:259-528(-)